VRQSRLLGSLAAVLRADGRAAAKAEAGSRGNGQLSLRTSKPIGAKVLLVEDDKINQVVARKLLEIFGCRVEVAGDGREAVALAATTPYDIVLMDARMPVMDGYEATQEIRRAEGPNRETPIIALTAHVLQGAREKCLEAGMNDYLPKPLDPKSVRTTLLRWCKGKSG
jgi:CheY-like chemotaxis protein